MHLAPGAWGPGRRSRLTGPLVAALVALCFAGLCLAPCVPHEVKLRQLERTWRAVVHPAGSRAVAYASAVGLLEGNGNHCDYFAGELRVGQGSLEALAAFYGVGVMVQAPDPTAYGDTPTARLGREALTLTLAPGEVAYVVSVFDQEAPGGDLRCH